MTTNCIRCGEPYDIVESSASDYEMFCSLVCERIFKAKFQEQGDDELTDLMVKQAMPIFHKRKGKK